MPQFTTNIFAPLAYVPGTDNEGFTAVPNSSFPDFEKEFAEAKKGVEDTAQKEIKSWETWCQAEIAKIIKQCEQNVRIWKTWRREEIHKMSAEFERKRINLRGELCKLKKPRKDSSAASLKSKLAP